MNKLLVLAALTVAAAPAMASKARMTSLGNAAHLIDTQTVFVNTADINYLGDYATIEFGSNANNAGTPASPRAEGGFTRTSSMGKWGAYLGRQSSTVNEFISAVNTNIGAGTLLTEQNALDLMYGTELAGQKWGFGVHYSAAKREDPAPTREVNTLGLSAGVRNDVWDAYLRIGLGGESKAEGTAELKQKGLYDVGFGYWLDTVYLSAKYLTTKGTLTAGGTDTDSEKNAWSVSAIDNMKVEGGNFFYGISYTSNEVKQGTTKTTTTGLPLIAGMEIDAASWLVLRGSISQNVFVGEVKTDTATNKMSNNTVVAAGAGVKFGKMTLDASLSGSGTTSGGTADGTVNGNNLLTQASLTYMF